jgi:hypothetical protein
MKLRLHGNSLRLRLNQAEVAQFSKTGYVEESIAFGPAACLSYILESCSKIVSPRAVYQNGELRVQVSCAATKEWVTTDRVGISGEQPLANGKPLSILIEKDFKCMHGDEADADSYPNPLGLGTRG